MAYLLDDDQLQVQALVRRVAREKVARRAADIDRTAEYPQDMYDLLRELGLFALPFPAEYGGSGSLLSSCIAVEELGRVCYNTAYLLIVQWAPFGAILGGGSDEQKARWLPGLASGELRAALSLTESQSGSDVAGFKTTARRTAGGYVLNGAKIWCTNSHIADVILVGAQTVDESGRKEGVSLFLVERDRPGLTIGKPEDKMGGRGVPSCPLFLDDVRLPANARLGEQGRSGFKVAMEALNASRPLIGARAVGLAQGATDHAVEFISGRTAFGQPVSEFQGMRWMIADMAMRTEAARQIVYSAAAQGDAGLKGSAFAPVAAMAKCFATDVAMDVATQAVQIFGAAGISADYPINRYFRDAKILQIVEGTNQIQRNIIADSVLGRPARPRKAQDQ
ncbi:MAG: acyl-CoA dehydrogenase domain protein [Ramlibacter sp.]|nr:acyl-CoA dehydrogenase domain protein [Ramlibacter sp.]